MNIQTVQTMHTELYKKTTGQKVASQKTEEQKTASADRKDAFAKTAENKTATGVYKRPSAMSADELARMEEKRYESFQKLLQSMVAKQGEKSNLSLFGLNLHVSQADSEKAAAAIAPGGEYSVDAVATRIMDMAKALAGGDPSKIELLKGGVIEGFQAAGVEVGGKLPSVCGDTYDEVMKRFDEWEKECSCAAIA